MSGNWSNATCATRNAVMLVTVLGYDTAAKAAMRAAESGGTSACRAG